jgi:hypothetical protein
MSKLPRHEDVDSKILNVDKPMGLFWTVTLAAALFIVLSAWVGLIGLYAAGLLSFNIWHYVWVPLLALAGVLLVPTALMLSKISWSILNMMAMTVEAWAARAGFSIDINRDGHIGYYEVLPPPAPELREPIAWNTQRGTRLLAKDTPAIVRPSAFDQAEEEPDDTPIKRRLIALGKRGKRVMVPAETIEQVAVEMIEAGKVLPRGHWVPKRLEREVFDEIIKLLERGKIIIDRKKGFVGKLAVTDIDHARLVLGGVLGPAWGPSSQPGQANQPQPGSSQAENS